MSVVLHPSELNSKPAGGATFAALPAEAKKPKAYDVWRKDLARWVRQNCTLRLQRSERFGLAARPEESVAEFTARLTQTAREQRDLEVEKLRRRYAEKFASLRDRLLRAQQAVMREQEQLSAKKVETAISFGTAILGAFLGRKADSATSAGRLGTAAKSAGRLRKESMDAARAQESAEAVKPIGIEDLIAYLVAACDLPGSGFRLYEIGGPDVVTYAEIMAEYARQRGLTRALIPVPFLTPRLSSLWLGLVTPLYARVGRELIGSLRNATVVRSDAAARDFPALKTRSLREAIARAGSLEDAEFGSTRWCDAASASGLPEKSWGGIRLGSRIIDSRSLVVEAEAGEAFGPIRRIGGNAGWYCANALWRVRGAIDLLAGGVGLRRGRRGPERLHAGGALDFWRVEGVGENRKSDDQCPF